MKTRIVILAAGKGTRMNSEIPKVLTLLHGKPMIVHLLESVRKSGVDAHPVIVVGYGADEVRAALGASHEYVEQKEQLGTGHAVQCAKEILKGKTENVIVLYGDHPFIRAETIRELNALHVKEQCPITVLTTRVEDFNDWRKPFSDFGRVIRNGNGGIQAIVEAKDASEEELKITEVNPALFCFSAEWLWPHLTLLKNQNAKKEYYLTDLAGIAIREGACIASVTVDPRESMGINTHEHLEAAEQRE